MTVNRYFKLCKRVWVQLYLMPSRRPIRRFRMGLRRLWVERNILVTVREILLSWLTSLRICAHQDNPISAHRKNHQQNTQRIISRWKRHARLSHLKNRKVRPMSLYYLMKKLISTIFKILMLWRRTRLTQRKLWDVSILFTSRFATQLYYLLNSSKRPSHNRRSLMQACSRGGCLSSSRLLK